MFLRQKLRVIPTTPTCFVSVPFRLKDRFFDQLGYDPKWEPNTKRWEIRVSSRDRIRAWLDAEMAKPWPKRAV
jgi:hypothetical protein